MNFQTACGLGLILVLGIIGVSVRLYFHERKHVRQGHCKPWVVAETSPWGGLSLVCPKCGESGGWVFLYTKGAHHLQYQRRKGDK
jgi:hypothetical protein